MNNSRGVPYDTVASWAWGDSSKLLLSHLAIIEEWADNNKMEAAANELDFLDNLMDMRRRILQSCLQWGTSSHHNFWSRLIATSLQCIEQLQSQQCGTRSGMLDYYIQQWWTLRWVYLEMQTCVWQEVNSNLTECSWKATSNSTMH